jgi:D-lactate dehydrogenase
MKIVIFDVEDWEREGFADLDREHDVHYVRESLTPENAGQHADAEVISTFVYSDLSGDTLQAFDHLKLIATRSTGYDHIDREFCQQHDMAIATVPEYGSATVAEHTFGLLLTISHRLEEAIDRTRKGDFSPRGLQGFDLHGKTLGVVGTGNIGRHVIQIAKGFGMHVIAYDLAADEDAAESLGFRYVSLQTLLGESDVITLHVPGSSATHHLLDSDEFNQMKSGVVILNTSRGSVINEQALLRALAEGQVAAAGLDVLPEEPVIREEAELLRNVYEKSHALETLLADQVLIRMRNVVVTPHSAFNTREAVGRIIETTVRNVQNFAGGSPSNLVAMEAPAS